MSLMLCAIDSGLSFTAKHPETTPNLEAIRPGKTETKELLALMGKPFQIMGDAGKRQYYFYRLGQGATMDTTILARAGVVEYVSYLCNETIQNLNSKFKDAKKVEKTVRQSGTAYLGALMQVSYPELGRGFIYEPKTRKVKACVSWVAGKAIEEVGI